MFLVIEAVVGGSIAWAFQVGGILDVLPAPT